MEVDWQTTVTDVVDVQRWLRSAASVFGAVTVSDFGKEFRGTMRMSDLDGVKVLRSQLPRHVLQRTSNHIDPGERLGYSLCLQLAGQSLIMQDGKELLLQPGDVSLLDNSRPYTHVHETEVECIGVVVPDERLSLPPAMLRSLIATVVPGGDLLASTSAMAIEQFQQGLHRLATPARYRLGQSFLSLFETLCLNWAMEYTDVEFDPRSHLRESVLRYIDEHLGDPALSPQDIADAHYISLRSLYSLAQQSGTSVAAWVRSRRLEHCRADLSDPFLTRLTVAEIGARWGFPHPPHFTTVFRAAFGETPNAYRKRTVARVARLA